MHIKDVLNRKLILLLWRKKIYKSKYSIFTEIKMCVYTCKWVKMIYDFAINKYKKCINKIK